MSRAVCLKPCYPTTSIVPQVTIPLMGSVMKASGGLTLEGGCNGCELVANLMLQLNPLLAALGLPLCILGCVGALVEFAKAVPDSLGPPPDPSKILSAVTDVVAKCYCIVGFVLPPPVGVICDFLKMMRDIINMIASIIDCLVGLVQHLLTLNLKASIALGSPYPEINTAGQCLAGQIQALMDALNGKLAGITTLFQAIQPVISLLASVTPPPFHDTMVQLSNGFLSFQAGISLGTPPGPFLDALNTFKGVVDEVATTFTTIVSVCP